MWDISVNWWHMERSLRYGVELPMFGDAIADELSTTMSSRLRLARQLEPSAELGEPDPNSLYVGYPRLRTGGGA